MRTLITLIILFFYTPILLAQSGYSGRLELGMNSDYHLMLGTTLGKFFTPNFFAGTGLGLGISIMPHTDNGKINAENMKNTLLIPFFVEAEYLPFKTRFSPFVSTQLGGESIITKETLPYGEGNKTYTKLVGLISPAIGFRVRVIEDASFNFKLSTHLRTGSTSGVSQHSYSYALGVVFNLN